MLDSVFLESVFECQLHVDCLADIENYNDIDIGRVQLKRSPVQGPASEEELRKAGVNVTINYTVNHNHQG